MLFVWDREIDIRDRYLGFRLVNFRDEILLRWLGCNDPDLKHSASGSLGLFLLLLTLLLILSFLFFELKKMVARFGVLHVW